MSPHYFRRRRGERGQMLVIVAVLGVLLFSVAALAVDLSVHTHTRRALQNATDVSALAGARDLPPVPAAADRVSAKNDAVATLQKNLGWGALGNQSGCPAQNTTCNYTATYGTAQTSCSASTTFPCYQLSVNIPPTTYTASCPSLTQCVEVILTDTDHNSFAPVMGPGHALSTDGAHSVAVHTPTHPATTWALFSTNTIGSGNNGQVVRGYVYSATRVIDQSNGHASFCVDYQQGSTTAGGLIVFGAMSGARSQTPLLTDGVGSCSGLPGGSIDQRAPYGTCYPGTTPDPTTDGCLASPALPPPYSPPPPPAPAANVFDNSRCGSIPATFSPGIYEIGSACTVTVASDQSCVTLILDPGATFRGNGKNGWTWTSYGDTGDGCTGPASARYVIYQPVSTYSPASTLSFLGPGCCPAYNVTGTIYAPSAAASTTTNAAVNVVGQAIVGDWHVQSGYHPNPGVTFDANNVPLIPEALRLTD